MQETKRPQDADSIVPILWTLLVGNMIVYLAYRYLVTLGWLHTFVVLAFQELIQNKGRALSYEIALWKCHIKNRTWVLQTIAQSDNTMWINFCS